MATVLVTGGTGILGSRLVPALIGSGHDVRVLSRAPSAGRIPQGASGVAGDVLSGEGLDEAASGADVVIHAATNPRRRTRKTEVDGTRNMLTTAKSAGITHFVYVSIVGVDRHRFPYYKAKWEAEQLVESSNLPWTVQRGTQFHELLDMFLGYGAFPATRHMAFQPVDAGEFSTALMELVEAGPCGRALDVGGPEVLTMRQLRDTRREMTGRRTLLLPAPSIGFSRDFDQGLHLAGRDAKLGEITWRQWLLQRDSQG